MRFISYAQNMEDVMLWRAKLAELMVKYPVNLEVLKNSLGIIVHSAHSLNFAKKWYPKLQQFWALIPHLRKLAASLDRAYAQKMLGIKNDAFVVGSFGIIARDIPFTRDSWQSCLLF